MTAAEEDFYTPERWENWLNRVREEDLDPDDEDAARLLLNLQDDTAIAIVKILQAYEDGELDEEATLDELRAVQEIVLDDVEMDDEDKALLIDGVQTSLVVVFLSVEEYIVNGPESEATIEELIDESVAAEQEDDIDTALWYCARAGSRILDGDQLDIAAADEVEYGLVAEWLNGLDSLSSAVSDPEVIEE